MKCSEKIAKKWPSFHCVGGLPGVNELPNLGPGLIIKQLFAGFALNITRDDRFHLWYREDYGSKLAETMVSCGKHWPGIAGQVRLLTLQPSLFLCAQPNGPGLSVLVLQSWAEVLERVPRCNSGLLQSNLAPASSSQGHQPTETLPWRSNIRPTAFHFCLASKCLEAGGLFFFHPCAFESMRAKPLHLRSAL